MNQLDQSESNDQDQSQQKEVQQVVKQCLSCNGSDGDRLPTRCYKCHRGVCGECWDRINNEIQEQTDENRKHCKYCFRDFESQCPECIEFINNKIKNYEHYKPQILERLFGTDDYSKITTEVFFRTQYARFSNWATCDCDPRCVCRESAKKTVKSANGIIGLSLYEIADPDDTGYAVTRCEQCIQDPERGNNYF